MTTVLDKSRIQCRFQNPNGKQCPMDAAAGRNFCKYHEPK